MTEPVPPRGSARRSPTLRHATAKRVVCVFMAATALASFVRIVGISVHTGTVEPWGAMQAVGNLTGFALLAAKLARPRESLTWLYVLLPQVAFWIEDRTDA